MTRALRRGGHGSAGGFCAVSRAERQEAEIFFSDLVGAPQMRRPPVPQLRDRARLPLPLPPPTEHDTTGVRPLRAGAVGPPIDGTVHAAHIGLVSPSAAFGEPPTQLASINGLTGSFTGAFAAARHAVTFDRAPGEPSPRFRDEAVFQLAGTDAQRWAALRWGLFDPATTAVLATLGGHGATRLLDELAAHVENVMNQQGHRWPLIPPVHEVLPPKRIVGFSDFTAVLLAAYSVLGWATIHGPMLCCPSDAASRTRLVQILTTAPANLYPRNEVDGNLTLVGPPPANPIRGVLLGGNLSLVDALYGSPFLPSLQGGLLFVEDVREEGRKIDRMIEGLKHRGAAAQARAVVVGQMVGPGTIPPSDVAALFRRSWNVPCVFGLQAGHGNPNLALWIGLEYELQFRPPDRASLFLRP